MSSPKRSVLITGCSDGGMGSALAIAFHNAGLKVYATARNPAKTAKLTSLGIETLALDVQSESSIAECAKKVPSLDILVNNAGQQHPSPISDMNIPEAKDLFDINVWAPVAVIQGFLPLLLKSSSPVIANNTSVTAVVTLPFQAAYNASKAALTMITDCLRLELQPWGVKVVDLKTGAVGTKIMSNARSHKLELPEGSIYEPAKETVEKALRGGILRRHGDSRRAVGARGRAGAIEEKPAACRLEGRVGALGPACGSAAVRIARRDAQEDVWVGRCGAGDTKMRRLPKLLI
ncbi:hypothetical protein F4818DRAFT_404113 [Hypoxylon cercidicola]|nr:hypothetical protein F4818DRAFT_404113 [Hypoxylon cercidicola]